MPKTVFDPRFALLVYNLALLVAAPLLLYRKVRRYRHNPNTRSFEFAPLRWACPPLSLPPHRPHIIFVANGIGEIRALDRVVQELTAQVPGIMITWAIQDYEEVQALGRTDHCHVPIPFDFGIPVQNWLTQYQPDVLVLVEKFWYPNLIWQAQRQAIQTVVVNGRSWRTQGTMWGLAQLQNLYRRWILGGIQHLLIQSEDQAQEIRPLLTSQQHLIVTGNLKFDPNTPQLAPDQRTSLVAWLETRGELPLFLAGSTHPGDELFILQAFQMIRQEIPCALLIAPRRLYRVPEIEDLCQSLGLISSLRSQPVSGAQVFLLDTVGELASVYQWGIGAFIGGTIQHGGHNVIEPLLWSIPVAYGPQRGYFAAEQRICEQAGVGFRVETATDLAHHWLSLLKDPQLQVMFKLRAQALLAQQTGSVKLTADHLIELMLKRTPSDP